MTIRCRTHKTRYTTTKLSIPASRASRCLAVGLFAALSVLMASPVLAVVKTWDRGGGNNNWNVANNWDPDGLPGSGDSALFDGSLSGIQNSISLNANFQIQGLRVQEPLQNNWDVLNAGGGTLTLQDDTDNAVFIEHDSWRTSLGVGYHSRLYAPIVFNDPLTITKTGGGQELKIHTSLTGGANGVTFNGGTLTETILFFTGSSMNWSGPTTVERGRVGINSAASMQIGSAGLTVTMATVGDAAIQWRPAAGSNLSNDNNFALGTVGNSWFDMLRGFSSATTLTLQGNFTGGATDVNLDFSVGAQTITTDTLILTGDINVDSRLGFLVGTPTGATPPDPPYGTMRLNGTITKANGGVWIESDAKLDGSGTIKFTLASATTAGPTNFGNLPIDLDGTLDISGMTADFTGSTVDGVSDYPLIVIDGGAAFTGPFASTNALPTGYEIQYSATEVKLAFVPAGPTITAPATLNMPENTSTATILTTVTATEGDAPLASPPFSISGDDAGHFTFDTTSGELRFAAVPDYENPADTNGDNDYQITITVTDTADKTDSQMITVTVTDVPETFIGVHALAEVEDGATLVGTLKSEPGDNASVNYSIEPGYDADTFEINGNNLDFVDAVTDATLGAEYYVNVKATGSDKPSDTNTMLIKVSVVAVGSSTTGTIFLIK